MTSITYQKDSKSGAASLAERKAGNADFVAGRATMALHKYSTALTLSPIDTEEECLAYGNRSAALFDMDHFTECVKDIKRALSFPHVPSKTQRQLHKRLAACKQRMLETEESGPTTDLHPLSGVPKISSANGQVQNLSGAVKISMSQDKGRRIIAARSIKHGDVILIEVPFAALLHGNNYDRRCCRCFCSLPPDHVCCQRCCRARFCNETCRDGMVGSGQLADVSALCHMAECGLISELQSRGILHLALRATVAAVCRLAALDDKMVKKMNQIEGKYGVDLDEEYSSLMGALSLLSHQTSWAPETRACFEKETARCLQMLIDSGKMKLLQEVCGCHILEKMVSVTTSGGSAEQATCFEEAFRLLLLRVLGILIANASTVMSVDCVELKSPNNALSVSGALAEPKEGEPVGAGLYPLCALLNHSCEPNIRTRYYDGMMSVVEAAEDICEGQEVYSCYGPRVGQMDVEERQNRLLEQYHFQCRCTGCVRELGIASD